MRKPKRKSKSFALSGKLDKHATDPGKLGKLGQKPRLAPMFQNKK